MSVCAFITHYFVWTAALTLTCRSDKKVLNAINSRGGAGALLHFLPDAADPNKRKQRVTSDAEKVFLLVRGGWGGIVQLNDIPCYNGVAPFIRSRVW